MRSFRKLAVVCAVVAALSATTVSADVQWVQVPDIGVDADTQPLSVTGGELSAPSDPDEIGVYETAATTILVGHVDWQGVRRAFARLSTLSEGSQVRLSDGRVYRVVSVEVIAADDLSAFADALHSADLVMLTCTGPFSTSKHAYTQRLIAKAALLS